MDEWNSWNGDGSDGWKIHGVDLNEGCNLLYSTAMTMVEAWISLFGWIHEVDLKSEPKKGCSSTIRAIMLVGKEFRLDRSTWRTSRELENPFSNKSTSQCIKTEKNT